MNTIDFAYYYEQYIRYSSLFLGKNHNKLVDMENNIQYSPIHM